MDRRLLIPGWPGDLDDAEFTHVAAAIRSNPRTRQRWGMERALQRPGWERAIRQIAMFGHPDNPAHNARLARQAKLPMRPVRVGPAKQLSLRIGDAR